MLTATYAVEAAIEETHWWYVGRRRLFGREIRKAAVPEKAEILDVGTGAGTNLRMLRDLGFPRVIGLDTSDDAIRWCAAKGLGDVCNGSITEIPFSENRFDLVLATDVIEHVDDDFRAVSEIARVLAPGGRALITVPAFPSLWGLQDEVGQHKRRYRLSELTDLVSRGGLNITHAYYFNYLLFLPIWIVRRFIWSTRIHLDSEAQLGSAVLDKILSGIFTLDILTAHAVRPPFGVSIFLFAEKPKP